MRLSPSTKIIAKASVPECPFTDLHLQGAKCSKIRSLASWHKDQRHAEGNWVEEACQSDCRRDHRGFRLISCDRPQAKEDASELLLKKGELEKEKKMLEDSALTKEVALSRKIKVIGNYVHDSVPIHNNEALHL